MHKSSFDIHPKRIVMRTYRLHKPLPIDRNPLKRDDLSRPEPGSGQIRIKVAVCGVCHTDLHIAEGDITPPVIPVTPGHQVVGYVDDIGPGITQYKMGDRVGVPWFYDACGTCFFCLSGNENLCPHARFTGFHVDGGFGEYMLA